MKKSEIFQRQLDSVKLIKLDEYNRVVISYDYINDYNLNTTTVEQTVESLNQWKQKLLNKIADYKVMESFEGLNPKQVQSHEKYSHYQIKNYGVVFYAKSIMSPTGVMAVSGCDTNEI